MSQQRVLLIEPTEQDGLGWEMYPSAGLLMLGTLLLQEGIRVELLHLVADGLSLKDVGNRIASWRPDTIGLTINTMQIASAKEVAAIAHRQAPESLMVAGGPHVTCLPQQVLENIPQLDAVCVGEAEESFVQLIKAPNQKGIPGVLRQGETFAGNIPRTADLDSLPFVRVDLVDLHRFGGFGYTSNKPAMFVLGSRGCPFNCSFCSKSVRGKSVRFRSPENILDEVECLHRNYGIREIYFLDDCFNLKLDRAASILKGLIDKGLNRHMGFRLVMRANRELVTDGLLKLAKRAGVNSVFFGVESGSQTILDRAGKNLTAEEVERAFRLAHKNGLETIASFVIGLPGESHETVKESLKLFHKIKPTYAAAQFASPLPDTELRKQLLAAGHLVEPNYDEYSFLHCSVRSDELTCGELADYQKKMTDTFLRTCPGFNHTT
jgi:anaerobic magnesium-protoporphyrin IX monomethyl ester cyclase